MTRREIAILAATAITLLLAAWIGATQPFGAPDEASHYLRALSITNGHLLGPRIPYPGPLTPAARAFVDHDTRAVKVPARLAPGDSNCANGRPDVTGCIEASPTGDYYPLAYVLPAGALAVSPNATTGLWLSRAASALPCAAFLILSFLLLWEGTGWSLLGLLGAITPMVLFVCSIINPSGLETAACIAFLASVLRIGRERTHAPPWVWAAFAVSGAVAIFSWQAGPGFVIIDLAVGVGFLGRSGWRRVGAASRRPLALSAAALLIATAGWWVYSRISGVSHSGFDPSPIRKSLSEGLQQLGPVLHDAVGHFGARSIALQSAVVWIWWVLVLLLIAAALWLGRWRERAVVATSTLVALAFPVVSYAWFYRHSGFGMQGRQVLPVLVVIPLAAGEVIRRGYDRLPRRAALLFLSPAIAVIAGIQGYVWWFAASTAGDGGAWGPPGGWLLWAAVAMLGVAGIVTLAGDQAFERVGGRVALGTQRRVRLTRSS